MPDTTLFMVSKNVRAVSEIDVLTTTLETSSGSVSTTLANIFPPLASGTQEVELEIAKGCHRLVQVQFGRPGGELDHTPPYMVCWQFPSRTV